MDTRHYLLITELGLKRN